MSRTTLTGISRALAVAFLMATLSTGAALAALPTTITSAATGVDGFSATLNGSVNANNESTTVTFEYSLDFLADVPVITTVAATPSPVTGNSLTAVSAAISGLTPGTTYQFRVVAANASGTQYGAILLFLTNPPATATTGIASPVTTTTAQLNGIVNANNNSTTVTFEYGLTTSYGTTVTADQSPVTGSVDTAVSKAITGLTPSTTYHFRVVADNLLGTTNGEDQTFFTAAQAPPTVTTEAATYSVVPNTATLHGTVNANNADATVTFEYGTTTAYGTTVTADQSPVLGSLDTPVSKSITGLIANTTYHYRAVATNGVGTTNGADQTFFNTTAPYAVADAPSFVTQTSAILQGRVNPKTVASGPPTTVTFEYGLTASYGNVVTAIESPIDGDYEQAVSYPLTGLTPNGTYHYRVVADNLNGTGTSADMTFTTSSLPVVQTLAAAPVGTTSATLNGSVNANNDSTTVTFEYGLTTAYGTTVTADQSPVTGTSTTPVSKAITGLVNGTTYHFRAVATNSSGTANGADQTFTTGVSPPSVTTQPATGIGTTFATMNGTVNANGLSTSVSFEWGQTIAYGQLDAAAPPTVTGSADTPVSFSPGTLLPNTTYHYRAVGQSAGGTIYGQDTSFTTRSAPTVTTDPATSVTTTSATLNGTVNANNESTTVTFEYGTTVAYGTTVTADQSPVTGSTDTAVSKAITGLTPNTTYHYRAVGTNASGTTYGADRTVSTTVGPPTVTTGSASPLVTGAVLNGTVNANNASTTVTFEYGTTVAYGTTATADQSPVTGSNDTPVTATVSGLSFNTTYHYRLVGTNVNGTTNGADMTFTTTLNPSATTLGATNVLATTATVNGLANGNGGVWSVRFDYGTTIAYGSTMAATPNQTSGSTDIPVTADLTGLTPNTTYHYRTTVYSGGFLYPGADRTFTTVTGPAVTTNAATAVGGTTATLNGTVNANNASTTVVFEWGFDTSYGQVTPAIQSPVTSNTDTAVSATLTTLVPNTTYHYRARAQNANGTVYGADMTFTTTALAPAAVTDPASGIGATGATLNGTVNAHNDSTTVTFEYGITVAYGTTVTADQSPVTGNLDTAVSKGITGLAANMTYHFRVVAQNGSGTTNGVDLTFTTGTNTPTVTTDPATSVGTGSATINGTVNANGASTTVTFEWGPTASYGAVAAATQSPVTGTIDTPVSANLTALVPNTTYHYRAVGQNAFGTVNGADRTFTTTVSAPTVVTTAATAVTTTGATLNGTVDANNADATVTFDYGLTTAYGTTVTAVPSPVTGDVVTAVSRAITGLAVNTLYHYRVVAVNSIGTSNGADMTFTTGAVAPTAVTDPVSGVTANGATLNATVTAGNDATTVTFEYGTTTAYGTTVAGTPSSVLGDVPTPVSSTIGGLAINTLYHYRVVAVNGVGTTSGADRTFVTASTLSSVVTDPATGVGAGGLPTATLNGTVNANNSDTTVTFEYGTSTSYGQTVAATPSPVTGAVDVPVSATLSGLQPNVLYHYRAVGSNGAGVTYGEDQTFLIAVAQPTEIPTASDWALGTLALLLLISALYVLSRSTGRP